jgi:hypothetical protein
MCTEVVIPWTSARATTSGSSWPDPPQVSSETTGLREPPRRPPSPAGAVPCVALLNRRAGSSSDAGIEPAVPVLVSDDLSTVLDVPGRVPAVDGTALDVPRGYGDAPPDGVDPPQEIPDSAWTAVTWSGLAADGASFDQATSSWTVHADGLWMMTVHAGWAINNAGTRRIRFRFDEQRHGPFGTSDVTNCSAAFTEFNPGAAAVTVTPLTTALLLWADAKVSVEVYQTSGAGLELAASTGAEVPGVFSMFWVGKWPQA